ncbi:hypothetical protein ACTQ6A_01960 [Lachnospiraceae bacterium LCP25S3_G4]
MNIISIRALSKKFKIDESNEEKILKNLELSITIIEMRDGRIENQISLNRSNASIGVLNQEDAAYIEELVEKHTVKYLESPFAVAMDSIAIDTNGVLNLLKIVPYIILELNTADDTSKIVMIGVILYMKPLLLPAFLPSFL